MDIKKLIALGVALVSVVLCIVLLRQNLLFAAVAAVVCILAVIVSYKDAVSMIIPDKYQIMLGACGVAAVFADAYCDWLSHILGAAFGFALFGLVAFVGGRIAGREALGGGDVKLALVSGLILGWQRLLLMLIIASVIGSIVMLIRRKKGIIETPFAPFLSLGLITALLVGDKIITAYISLFV